MSTAAMAVWIITVIIGAYLLAAGIGNQHRQAEAAAGTAGARPGGSGSDTTTTGARPGTAEAGTGHPLLEFCHPALGVIGLMFWIFYVVTNHPVFAWTAFGMLAATALAGITWLASGIAGRRRARVPPAPVFPRHLVLLHGVAVTCTAALVLIAAIGHG